MATLHTHSQKYHAPQKLEQILSRSVLAWSRRLTLMVIVLASMALVADEFFALIGYQNLWEGVIMISLGVWLLTLALSWYQNTYYFFGLDSIIGSGGKIQSGCTYEVAALCETGPNDLTMAWLRSPFGQQVMRRLGLDQSDAEAFLDQPRTSISAQMVFVPDNELVTMPVFTALIYQYDSALRSFFESRGVVIEILNGAILMCQNQYIESKRTKRWWSRDRLSYTRGIGSELAYGTTSQLERYSRSLLNSTVYSDLGAKNDAVVPYCERIEQALARDKSANVLLIGNTGVGKMDIVLATKERLHKGQALHSLAHSHFILLDTDRLFTDHAEASDLETALVDLFEHASQAGNCVVIIEHLSSMVAKGAMIGVNIPEVLDIFLARPYLHVIALDTPDGFHNTIENADGFTRRFEEILVAPADARTTIKILESLVLDLEKERNIFFTYAALTAIVSGSERYLNEGVMPEKAIDLLRQIAGEAPAQSVITPEFVYTYIGTKTGIPLGPVSEEERDVLLRLEEILDSKIIAQRAATSAIAKTMRRARVSVEANDKPIGSFLFLGPTGVGKTESAKVLAEVFFGDQAALTRLDMSEYSGPDDAKRLLGTSDTAGILASQLQERPYTVLLLDEFEKAHYTVHDLFLQILDEGSATDGRGERINARHAIIIATSNAGSDLIINTSHTRAGQPILDQEIISHIMKNKILRPELINRFDATIVFEPLSHEAKVTIANIFLGELEDRLRQDSYLVNIDRNVIPLLIELGFNDQFGARPLLRAIQDTIEDVISKRILSGQIKKGESATISLADIDIKR